MDQQIETSPPDFAPNASVPCDVAVVGAGAIGLASALALTRRGFKTVLVGSPGPVRTGRTVALLEGTVALLRDIGVWEAIAPHAAPLARMRIVDATGSLFRAPPVEFDAAELGRSAFGFNVPNTDLEATLLEAVRQQPGLTTIEAQARRYVYDEDAARIETASGVHVVAELVVAADGRQSLARKMAGIGVRTRSWPQTALTGTFTHTVPHRSISTEFHTRQGPFTLVPLPDATDGRHRSSLVWVMKPDEAERRRHLTPEAMSRAVTEQAAWLLGSMTLESGLGTFPIATTTSTRMVGPRLALLGEAAHALPPIGAQGLNLSFRDVADLLTCLQNARERGHDLGSSRVLAGYAAARQRDVALRTLAVDALNGSLLSRSPLVDAVRGGGLAALQAFGPIRRGIMRQGLVPGDTALRRVVTLDAADEHRRSTRLI